MKKSVVAPLAISLVLIRASIQAPSSRDNVQQVLGAHHRCTSTADFHSVQNSKGKEAATMEPAALMRGRPRGSKNKGIQDEAQRSPPSFRLKDLLKMTIAEQFQNRPTNLAVNGRQIRFWNRGFDLHPRILPLDPHLMDSVQLELEFRKLRPIPSSSASPLEVDEISEINRRLSFALERNLKSKDAPDWYIRLVCEHWQQYQQAKVQAKFHKQARNPTDQEGMERYQAQKERKNAYQREKYKREKEESNGSRVVKVMNILHDLQAANIDQTLDVLSTEEATRSWLHNKYSGETAISEALLDYFGRVRGEAFAKDLIALRKSKRRRAAGTEAQRQYRARQRIKKGQSSSSQIDQPLQDETHSHSHSQDASAPSSSSSSPKSTQLHEVHTLNSPLAEPQWDHSEWWDGIYNEHQ